eukprot:TRINITY_DN949_c0_g1_i5.p1 TRINITY_DN949_c0_g1~~TRINITY_DN949_c0_g1_i5.p1  ORF type:complete len:163 (+),score=35.82 TRINITY_DN949_c0_g1_i5:56-490(+)
MCIRDRYYNLAKELGNGYFNYQADASLHLANLCTKKGMTIKALEYYQFHFDNARSEKKNKDRKLIDRARVIYGIAKANSTMPNHIKVVANSDKNIKALLDWKNRKEKQRLDCKLYFSDSHEIYIQIISLLSTIDIGYTLSLIHI